MTMKTFEQTKYMVWNEHNKLLGITNACNRHGS